MKPSERCAETMIKLGLVFSRKGGDVAVNVAKELGGSNAIAGLIAKETGCDEMLELFEIIAGSGVEHDGPTNSYLTMQVDRDTVKDAKTIVAKFKANE